jgi:hypothetical protein
LHLAPSQTPKHLFGNLNHIVFQILKLLCRKKINFIPTQDLFLPVFERTYLFSHSQRGSAIHSPVLLSLFGDG